jgi:hypothetical protein
MTALKSDSMNLSHKEKMTTMVWANILNQWVDSQWEQLEFIAERVSPNFPEVDLVWLNERLASSSDFSELFVINMHGLVISSTFNEHVGHNNLYANAVAQGVSKPFLQSPYIDQMALKIGHSSCKFHDEVTLTGASSKLIIIPN